MQVRKNDNTIVEETIQAIPSNIKNARFAMRASAAHYN